VNTAPSIGPKRYPNIAHVVRRYGGVTEPFIQQRVTAPGSAAELWYERLDVPSPVTAVQVPMRAMRAGSALDRMFHRVPQIGRAFASPYRTTERERTPDAIHAHYLTTGYLVGSVTKGPLVVSAYGFDVTVLPQRPTWRAAFPLLAIRADLVLVEGPFMQRTVLGLGIPDDKVRLVPIAAGLDGIPYRGPRTVDAGIRLVCCGRLVPKKGHELAIKAFAAARSDLPAGSHLAVIGDGPLRPHLEGLVHALGVADAVTFLGALGRVEYLAELSGADILLAPSLTARNGDGEGGAPTTILDAQAAGVLTLGSTHADIPYLVAHGITGFLFREGDADGLRAAILDAVERRAEWPAIGQSARQQVERRHSDTNVAALLLDAYEQVLK
jgi:glycosyltransferase involved in cell wall biosynthesis